MQLISVIVPCYNQAQYLDDCLQSVLDQTYQNWECIIVNDGSPDHTEEIALRWTARDGRFKYVKKQNGGLSSARNAGIEVANGEWLQFLDCDDKIMQEKFQISHEFFFNYEIVISDFILFKESKLYPAFCKIGEFEINRNNIIQYWDEGLNIPIHCALIRRSSIGDIRFNVDMKSKEDWIFWIALLKKRKKIKFIPQVMAFYRINPQSVGTVSDLIRIANQQIYNDNDSEVRAALFNKINRNLLASKQRISQLERELIKLNKSKPISAYLSFRRLLYKVFHT